MTHATSPMFSYLSGLSYRSYHVLHIGTKHAPKELFSFPGPHIPSCNTLYTSHKAARASAVQSCCNSGAALHAGTSHGTPTQLTAGQSLRPKAGEWAVGYLFREGWPGSTAGVRRICRYVGRSGAPYASHSTRRQEIHPTWKQRIEAEPPSLAKHASRPSWQRRAAAPRQAAIDEVRRDRAEVR